MHVNNVNIPGRSVDGGSFLLENGNSRTITSADLRMLQQRVIESHQTTIESLSNYRTDNKDVIQAIKFYIAELEGMNEELRKPIVLGTL